MSDSLTNQFLIAKEDHFKWKQTFNLAGLKSPVQLIAGFGHA